MELIKQHPALAVDLLRAVTGMPLRAGLDVRLASTSLNTVTPIQYSADSVVVVSDPDTGEALVAIIVEPQGRDERTQTMEWKSDFIEGYEERGRVATKRKDVLKVLDVRRLSPTEAQRAQVEASTDLAQLDQWFERSLTAATAADVFKD